MSVRDSPQRSADSDRVALKTKWWRSDWMRGYLTGLFIGAVVVGPYLWMLGRAVFA